MPPDGTRRLCSRLGQITPPCLRGSTGHAHPAATTPQAPTPVRSATGTRNHHHNSHTHRAAAHKPLSQASRYDHPIGLRALSGYRRPAARATEWVCAALPSRVPTPPYQYYPCITTRAPTGTRGLVCCTCRGQTMGCCCRALCPCQRTTLPSLRCLFSISERSLRSCYARRPRPTTSIHNTHRPRAN